MCGKWFRNKVGRTLRHLQEKLSSEGSKVSSPATAPTDNKHTSPAGPPSTPPFDTAPPKPSTSVPELCLPTPPAGTSSPDPTGPSPDRSPLNEPRTPSPQPCKQSTGSDGPAPLPRSPSDKTRTPSPEPPIPSFEPPAPCPLPQTPQWHPHPSKPQPATPSKEPCEKFPQPQAGPLLGAPPKLLLSPAKTNSKISDVKTVLVSSTSSSIIMPAFILHAFAVLAGLQGYERLEHARSIVSSMYKQVRTTQISPATISRQFLSFTLPSNSPLLMKSQFYLAADPIRLAFVYLALSLSNCENEANLVLCNEQAFLDLFSAAVHQSLVWDVFAASSSFAWSPGPHAVHVFEVSCIRFVNGGIILPISDNTWFDSRSLVTGMLPGTIKLSYMSGNPESFLLSSSNPLRAMVAAARYGADWDYIVKSTFLSKLRNTTSWRLSTSAGKLFRGVYIEPMDYLLSILQFGCINETKLYDIVEYDLPDSTAIRNLVANAEAIRVEARRDKSRTFRQTVLSRMTALRGKIREAVASFGCVFRSGRRCFWIGAEDGVLRVKKAIPLDDNVVTKPDNDTIGQFMSQDAKFLIEDAPGIIVRSTRELLEVDRLGDLGLCVMFACWMHGKVRIDAKYEGLLARMSRMKRKRASNDFVCVDSDIPYASLFVLADSVFVDRSGQGWVEGYLFVAGLDGNRGWLVPGDRRRCYCEERALVEAEFRVDPQLKIAPG